MDGSALVYRFLIDLKRYGQVDNQRSLSQHNVRLMPIYRFLDESYSNPSLGLPDMAAYAGISPQQLSYLFRKTTGMSPYQYLIHLRIQKAKELLVNDQYLTIKAIALSVGFQDASHFASSFRRLENIPPGKYRDLHTYGM
jgi:AraC-like DNA-binding protein